MTPSQAFARHYAGLLRDLLAHLPLGRQAPIPGSVLAATLGVSERTIRALVGELIDRGYVIGTSPGAVSGYFRCGDRRDVEVGLGHLIARSRAMERRVRILRRSSEREFGPEVLTLFDAEAVSA